MRRWVMGGGEGQTSLFHPDSTPPFNRPPRPLRPAPGMGTAPGKRPHPRGEAWPHIPAPSAPPRPLSQCPPTPLGVTQVLRVRSPGAARSRGRGEHPLSPSPPPPPLLARGPVRTGYQGGAHRASGPHTRPEPAPTHCSGRRPAGPAPWPPSGLHRDPRPLRPRRPGPGAEGTHLHRAHHAGAILAASSSRAAPAAATTAAALCSARRGGRGRGGEGTAARSWGRGQWQAGRGLREGGAGNTGWAWLCARGVGLGG